MISKLRLQTVLSAFILGCLLLLITWKRQIAVIQVHVIGAPFYDAFYTNKDSNALQILTEEEENASPWSKVPHANRPPDLAKESYSEEGEAINVLSKLMQRLEHVNSSEQHVKGPDLEPDVFMNATQLATSKGYPCQDYYVHTEDGFILNIQRIPYGVKGLKTKENDQRPVVFLQHGLTGSSIDFMANLGNESLAFILADAGADVWMGNMRGNVYSKKHFTLDPSELRFWKWTFDEMARYDLPAMLNFVKAVTGSDQIYYVGHSQGCGTAIIEWSRNPKLGLNIKHFYAMAPATRLKYSTGTGKAVSKIKELFADFFDVAHHGSTDIGMQKNIEFVKSICQVLGYTICRDAFFTIVGNNTASFNTSRLPVYFAHFPQSTSANIFLHYFQLMVSGEFQNFDEGSPEDNINRYGQPTPPLYNLTNFDVPTTIFYGGHDVLVQHEDVTWLMKQIKSEHNVYVPFYEHMDFIWGIDAAVLVYKDIVRDIFKDWPDLVV